MPCRSAKSISTIGRQGDIFSPSVLFVLIRNRRVRKRYRVDTKQAFDDPALKRIDEVVGVVGGGEENVFAVVGEFDARPVSRS